MKMKYTDEFKLEVIKDYYRNDLGVRLTAQKWGLPSKNYINKWEEYLKRKNLLPKDLNKKPSLHSRTKSMSVQDTTSEELQALRKQNQELKCALAFEKELNKQLNVKKKKSTK